MFVLTPIFAGGRNKTIGMDDNFFQELKLVQIDEVRKSSEIICEKSDFLMLVCKLNKYTLTLSINYSMHY